MYKKVKVPIAAAVGTYLDFTVKLENLKALVICIFNIFAI